MRVLLNLAAETTMDLAQVWAEIDAVADRERLATAVEPVDELVPGDEDDQGAKRPS
jgi:hypothetical protein